MFNYNRKVSFHTCYDMWLVLFPIWEITTASEANAWKQNTNWPPAEVLFFFVLLFGMYNIVFYPTSFKYC